MANTDDTATAQPLDLTDAEWSRFQDIPEQGYSHRHWLNHRNNQVMQPVLREAVARALEEAAQVLDDAEVYEELAKPTRDNTIWGARSIVDAVNGSGPISDWLRSRATDIRSDATGATGAANHTEKDNPHV